MSEVQISIPISIIVPSLNEAAKVEAMTALDLLMRPELVTAARDYFVTVQQAPQKYKPLLRPDDKPAIWLNKETMDRFNPELRKYYYDPSKYKSYLDQLGIKYPTVKTTTTSPQQEQ